MRTLLITLLSLFATSYANAEFDPAAYLAEKCSRCHGTEVYTRPDRRVKSLDRLESQVRRCDANLGTFMFDDDIKAMVDYLNTNFYKF